MPTAPAVNRIGANLCAARAAFNNGQGITQLALAHAIGWKGPDAGAQIARYETGVNEPKLSTLHRLAEALGVELDALTKSK